MSKKIFLLACSLFLLTACVNPNDTTPTPPSDNEAKNCTQEYEPVCAEQEVQCVTTPCNPIKTTFQNRCEAEKVNATVLYEGVCKDEEPNPEGACLSFDGNWLEEFQECEGMSQEQCENLGGNYNECASACRHDPDAEICTQQCVQVCEF